MVFTIIIISSKELFNREFRVVAQYQTNKQPHLKSKKATGWTEASY